MIRQYFRQHIRTLIMLFFVIGAFFVSFYLYQMPMEPAIYGLMLSLFFILVLGIWDYFRFKAKHQELQMLKKTIILDASHLPEPTTLFERDYQALLRILNDSKMEYIAASDSERADMLDYYTMWVHQIKTPISAMSLLLKAEDTPANTAMWAQLFKIEQYVEMVLSYLRLGSNTTDYVIRPCSIEKITRDAVRKYARIFVMKKLSLTFDLQDFTVITDEKWLSFVIEQLLSNALKYTPSGGIKITADSEKKILFISDTGIGIGADDLPRVFEKGFTGYNGHSNQKSSGLGLYLCKRIMDKLSHTITIQSAPGEGTTIMLELDAYKSSILSKM